MDANELLSQKLLEQLQTFPEDVILEILSKLPLTSLLTFRCVSKFWNFQFNENPKFIHMIKNSFSIMLIDDKRVCSLDNNSLSSSLLFDDGIEGHVKKIHCPLVPLGWDLGKTNFVGSCNGLFCMHRRKDSFCLWNPCTNEIKFLSRLGFEREKMLCVRDKGHGFGYDSKNNDYKYVCFFRYNGGTNSELHIYSFKTNVWKQMYVPYALVNVEQDKWAPNGVFCNGALHWFAREISSYYPKVLLAFDMVEEVLREVPQPENLDTKKFGSIKYVDVLDECLCVLYSNSAGFEVWVMKDYGKRESWTKMYSITELTLLEAKSFVYLRKVVCLRTREILLEVQYDFFNTAALVLYDPKNETSMVLKLHRNFKHTKLRSPFYRYVKSLVKLHPGSYVRETEQEENDQQEALSIRD
ncbi:hypothetical protein MKX01_035613 [Papaver californicum]|nr:hypothetical protein MKX01_035613 [Papaver californicum]